MIPSDRVLATSYRLSSVNSNHVSICNGLAAIFSGRFQAIQVAVSRKR